MQQFAATVRNRELSIDNDIGFMDGVSFTSECTSEQLEEMHFTLVAIMILR